MTVQQVQEPAGSSVVLAGSAACGGVGATAFVGVGSDVLVPSEPGTGQGAGEEAALSEMTAEVDPEQTEEESALVAAAVAVAADEPAPEATAWTAEVDGFVEIAVEIRVLGLKALWALVPHRPPATFGEVGKTTSPVV